MRHSTQYVGLDVHRATTSAAVRESSGKIIARSVLPTGEAALLEFFAGVRGKARPMTLRRSRLRQGQAPA